MLVICNSDNKNKLLEDYIKEFIKIKGHKLIGVDFEFNRVKNKREIALCQIKFVKNNKDDIFLFYPPDINKDIFKNLLLSDCIKILHGSESLDLPYLFDNIISINDRDKFFHNLIDTRYLCEYYNSSNNIEGKCRIYDLLLNMKVINKKKYDDLMKNDKLMGNIWDINIDIKNMSRELIKYSIYDVLYLPQLYYKFPKDEIYNEIIPEIGNISFILRYENKLDDLFSKMSKYNTKKYIDNYTFNDVYIVVNEWIMIDEFIYNLNQINYFRKFIELLIKNILYNNLDSSIELIDFNLILKNKNNKLIKLINKYVKEIV
jgi:hypothetical protein